VTTGRLIFGILLIIIAGAGAIAPFFF